MSLLILAQGGFAAMIPQEKMMEELAIRIPAKEKAQYVYGDNIKGYFEGYTHAYQKGEGYKMLNTALYRDFASLVKESVNDKKKGIYSLIYPYGQKTVYSAGSYDEFVLLNKEYAICLHVHDDKADKLALLPLFTLRSKSTTVEKKGDVVLFYKESSKPETQFPTYIAVSSSQPFRYYEGDREKNEDLKSTVKVSKSVLAPIFESSKKVNDFTINIAFGFTKEEALAKAQAMAKEDSIARQKKKIYDFLTRSYFWTDDQDFNRALMWSKLSAYSLVSEEYGKGIWAGLPWFKDNWGRDTFISLPGTLLVTGQFNDAMIVLTNFSVFQNRGIQYMTISYADKSSKSKVKNYIRKNWGSSMKTKQDKDSEAGTIGHSIDRYYLDHPQELEKKIAQTRKALPQSEVTYELIINKEYGRIPNRVSGSSIIYNTTDGTPWLIREAWDYLRYTGDESFKKEIYPVIKLALDGSIKNYVDAQGFLTHADADTWMDARIAGAEPWSARGNRAVDIQVLWYTSLRFGEYLASEVGETQKAVEYGKLADKLKENFPRLFWNSKKKILADRVTDQDRPDYKVRPNQLMVISVPFEDQLLSDDIEAYIVKNAVSELLYPYGIASLSQNDPYFHPLHEDWDKYHKDAAYHNGTVWGWNAGPTITAMTRFNYTDLAFKLSQNLAHQILYQGCRGSMSEVMDAIQKDYENLHLTGTYSQAWSVAEFARNGYEDYAGFQPDLLKGTIRLAPSIPSSWKNTYAKMAFADKGQFHVEFSRSANIQTFVIWYEGYDKDLQLEFAPAYKKGRVLSVLKMSKGQKVTITYDESSASLSSGNKALTSKVMIADQSSIIGDLRFQTPDLNKKYPMSQGKNLLEGIIKSGKFE